ncbi:MAG: 6-carboxytetrahydropterin synthase QueD [Planctomycetota bacterium]|nr:6-carboxytetrahydropterin synthase QueD [Planctomycetota bacterium]
MRVELTKEFRFEAAHRLTCAPEGHRCRGVHGHSYRVEVSVEGEVDPARGWLMDYGDISAAVKPIVDEYLDHGDLNALPGIGTPTAENLARWLWERIKPKLPALSRIVVRETDTTRCEYRGA